MAQNKQVRTKRARATKSRTTQSTAKTSKTQKIQPQIRDTLSFLLADLRENLNQGFIGLFILLVGGLLFITLVDGGEMSWLERATGWIAPWVTIAIMLTGLVFVLGRRAGYWSIEAVVGTQLLLISLMVGTFAGNNPIVDWSPRYDGSDGGWVGWTFGSMLVAALGQWPAFAVALVAGLFGVWYLLRYTPLIHAVNYALTFFPFIPRIWQWLSYRFARIWHDIKIEFGAFQSQTARHKSEYQENDYRKDAYQTTRVESPSPAKPVIGRDPDRARQPQPAQQEKTASRSKQTSAATASASPRKQPPSRAKKASVGKFKPRRKPDQLPSIDLLDINDGASGLTESAATILEARIKQTLEDFDVPVEIVHRESGPTVTQFGVEPQFIERAGRKRKIRVNRIVNLADDLALALEAPSIRIEAPVPGKPYVGIEVPNSTKSIVGIRGILESPRLHKEGRDLPLAMGRDTAGRPVIMNLGNAPHMLIAGSTGSGKSVCINTIITSLLMVHGPESLKFLMVDPKMVELPGYNGIPHLIGKVITDTDQVMGMLTWLLLQMDDRYRAFKDVGVRNLESYNALVRKQRGKDAPKPLPFIVLIVDELADLMMTAADDIERQLCRLAQMARATGIHLILATQRPSADVVTGLIKANFPTRIAFAVTSQIDSRVIMDTPGAERLLGKGDMLMMRSDSSKLERVQGCYVDDKEINRVVKFWKERRILEADPDADPAALDRPVVPPWNALMDTMDEEDELIHEATDLLRGMSSCSTSLVQRKLKIGYPKAARLMEELESRGVVGADMGGGQGRKVLLKEEESDDDEYARSEENEVLF